MLNMLIWIMVWTIACIILIVIQTPSILSFVSPSLNMEICMMNILENLIKRRKQIQLKNKKRIEFSSHVSITFTKRKWQKGEKDIITLNEYKDIEDKIEKENQILYKKRKENSQNQTYLRYEIEKEISEEERIVHVLKLFRVKSPQPSFQAN